MLTATEQVLLGRTGEEPRRWTGTRRIARFGGRPLRTRPSDSGRVEPAWLPPVAPRAYASTVHIAEDDIAEDDAVVATGEDVVRLPLPGVGDDGMGTEPHRVVPAADEPTPGAGRGDRVSLVVRARRVVLPDGERPAAVHAVDGRITAVTAFADAPASAVTLADDEVLLPGLVDSHVHVNEPGRTEWEGFASATRAAVAGGITTIVDMPLNSIPATTTLDALHVKREAAKGQVSVDVAFWGGVVPGNLDQLHLLHEAGVVGFKCFLLDSGVPDFPPLDDGGLRAALAELAAVDGLLIAHAEDADVIAAAPEASGPSYAGFLASRPGAAEESAIGRLIAAARDTGARVHVVHLADADALPILRKARADRVRITVETCPHYLAFAAEDVPDGATSFKCCPPIREARHREGLWGALSDGDVDLVVSDHSPCTADLKRLDAGDFGTAWGGIASLQVALPVVWSGARARGIGLDRVVRWMAETPARLVGLPAKGSIAVGKDADLVAFAPEERWTVGDLEHRNPVTPYAGRELHGVVRRTWLRGQAADGGPIGRLLDRGGA